MRQIEEGESVEHNREIFIDTNFPVPLKKGSLPWMPIMVTNKNVQRGTESKMLKTKVKDKIPVQRNKSKNSGERCCCNFE